MRSFQTLRSIKFFLPIACIILLCAGCFRFNVTIAVEDDGTGTLGGEYAISKQLSQVFGDESEELSCDEILEANGDEVLDPLSDFPSGAVVENFEDDEWCGYTFTASFTDFGRSFIEAGDDDFPIREEDGLLFFNLPTEDLGLGDSDDFDMGDEDVDPIMLLQAFGIPQPEFTISVDIPGEILEHNADTRDGSTLTWAIDFLNPKSDFSPYAKSDLSATAEVKGKPTFGIIAGIVGAISLILAAKFVRAKNNETL